MKALALASVLSATGGSFILAQAIPGDVTDPTSPAGIVSLGTFGALGAITSYLLWERNVREKAALAERERLEKLALEERRRVEESSRIERQAIRDQFERWLIAASDAQKVVAEEVRTLAQATAAHAETNRELLAVQREVQRGINKVVTFIETRR